MSHESAETKRSFYLEIFLISLAVLLLQISYTRILSFKFASYFTYMVIGLAMLGIGSGGVFVAVSSRLRTAGPEKLLPLLGLAGGVAITVGYGITASIETDLYRHATDIDQIARLALISAAVFAGFLVMGLVVAVVFAHRPGEISRLYFADLMGAGAGCALAIPLMMLLTPPGCVFASAAAVSLIGARSARSHRGAMRFAPFALALPLALIAGFGHSIPDPTIDVTKHLGREELKKVGPVLFSAWSPVYRVDVLEAPKQPWLRAIAHDGLWISALWNPKDPGIDTSTVGKRRRLIFAVTAEDPKVLIIGSAGGYEIMVSLFMGASHVTGVEINPVTQSLMRDHFAEWTDNLASDPRVTLINAEGRSFLRRDTTKYDLINLVSPDSFATLNAAQASGFVMAESYLYTKDMIKEALERLEPGGIISMNLGDANMHRPSRMPRFLATARLAFEEVGIENFSDHVIVAVSPGWPYPGSTVLLKETPFTTSQVDAFMNEAGKDERNVVHHAPRRAAEPGPAGTVVRAPSKMLQAFYDNYEYQINPVSDDAPFFYHTVRFSDLFSGKRWKDYYGLGEGTLLIMLAISTSLALIFLILPFAFVRNHLQDLPHKGLSALYFAALGMGFMSFEVSLIQKLTLFLGFPTYTLSVTLFSLLVFSGLGSLATERYIERRDKALIVLPGILIALTIFYMWGLDEVARVLGGQALSIRIACTVVMLAPLGLCLGAFMPMGLTTVARTTTAELRGAYVAWGWAVNGFFSVIGSLLVTMLSMTYGFRAMLMVAALLYVLASALLRALPLRPSTTAD